MYELTKIYKSKAMAVNAIRMTATNKGWKVLSTNEAAKYVYPHAEGYEVANAELNVALGFDVGPITDGKVLEAVSDALAEQKAKDSKAPKLQAPSKLEESKKAAKAAKVAVKTKSDVNPQQAEARATRCNVVNGARRPLRGKTLLVWEVTERLQKTLERVPSLKEVHEQLVSMEPGFNKTTAGIQYYACRAYNGWASDKK